MKSEMKSEMKPLSLRLAAALSLLLLGCAPPQAASPKAVDTALAQAEISRVLDDFHDAATKADEARYFGHLRQDAVFLGTDATERWDKEAFRAYAHPHFAKRKAWSFRAIRRATVVGAGGQVAWFDEDLATQNMGPARGSGVLLREAEGSTWKIAHYNLSVTIPNERFAAVKRLLAGEAPAPPATP
jgi:ketosteroid isomerase-like protein